MNISRTLLLISLFSSLIPLQAAYGFSLFDEKKTPAVAADQSRVIVATQLRLLEIDGVKHSLNLLNSGETVVDVAPGYHEFTVRYDKIWDIDYDNFEKLKSKPVTVEIVSEGTKSYRITHRDLESYQEAKAFSESPEILVVDTISGANVQAANKTELIPAESPVIKDKPVVAAPAAAAVAASPGTGKEIFTPTEKTATQAGSQSPEPAMPDTPVALPMLQYWWGQASVEEKQRFYDWVKMPRRTP